MDPSAFSLDVAILNLSSAFDSIQKLIVALSYVIGLGMVARGVMMYKAFADQTFHSQNRAEMAGPIVWIIIGCVLIYFPRTLDSSLITLFGSDEISGSSELIAWQSTLGTEKWKALSEVVIKYIKLVGFIAFLRGWIILSKMGHSGAQPGSITRAMVHVLGGILLIAIVDTVNILARTFGYVG